VTNSAVATLRELASELRALFSRIGDGADGEWQASWTRCEELYARYRADPPALRDLPAGERASLTSALDEVVRLNAVAAGLASRESERLSATLRSVGSSRRRVREQSDAPDTAGTGNNCDIRG
jgi:hypothetical protein